LKVLSEGGERLSLVRGGRSWDGQQQAEQD